MSEPNENIRDLLIEDEMRDSYMSYAMSVIMSRALPDARDGLKPSQRRILIAMDDLNLRNKRTKCAGIVGETMKSYHPHGDQAIYPTLVRMAQDFSTRYPLVTPKGNFGSTDGDPPAAMRYTEAQLSPVTLDMLADINMDTVDFVPNYDESLTEPRVLPSKFPNLLCNGAVGIAVGMATSIPPHNAREICDAMVKLLDDPACDIRELLSIVHGPDFPTGGLICGRSGIRKGYTTGRGQVTVRARCHVEEGRGARDVLVFTEIPYMANKQRITERIASLVNAGKIPGITGVVDRSDRTGMRLEVVVRRGDDPNVVLNQLFQYSALQETFSIIMLAIVDGRPRTLNLKEMLECFRDHRVIVIRRRTQYQLQRARERAHILEGLRIALANIDDVVELIKRSADVQSARTGLMAQFKLTRRQADAILQMQLQRLTNLEQEKIESEYRTLLDEISGYERILADPRLILDIIREDMYEIKKKFGDARRTQIIDELDEITNEDLITEEQVAVSISHQGYIKRQPLDTYRRQRRGGKGIIGAPTKEEDFVERLFVASTHDYLLFFTNKGKVYWQKVYDIPQMSRTSRGRAVVNLLNLASGEKITSMIPVNRFDDRQLVMATRRGIVKKTELEAYSRPKRGGIIAINLDPDDELIGVHMTRGDDQIVLGTRNGLAIRFHENDLRSMGRVTHGVKGIRLGKDDNVVGMEVVDPDATLLTVCERGHGKRTEFTEYRTQTRGGKGLINIRTTDRNGSVVAIASVRKEDDLMLISASGMVVRTSAKDISTIGRNTQGVRVIRLGADDRLVAVAKIALEKDGAGEADADATEDTASGSAPDA